MARFSQASIVCLAVKNPPFASQSPTIKKQNKPTMTE